MLSLKNILRTAIYRSARHPIIYTYFWHPIGRLSQLAAREHQLQSLQIGDCFSRIRDEIKGSNAVIGGPFAGMNYASCEASGSTLLPKLLGCYEQELHNAIHHMLTRKYSLIIDIGCAEGYYAIGFARQMAESKVIAIDTDEVALERCRAMAEANDVISRIEVRTFCSRQDLISLPDKYGLIFCDCEGYEEELFAGGAQGTLVHYDLLIEVHEFIRPFLLAKLRNALGGTHDVELIRTVPDWVRPVVYPQRRLQGLLGDDQILLMSEMRPSDMTWLWCRSKYYLNHC